MYNKDVNNLIKYMKDLISTPINKKSTKQETCPTIVDLYHFLRGNGTEREITQEFVGYGAWSYMVLPNNIEKMLVYDKNELLYEEYFKNVINIIEFY